MVTSDKEGEKKGDENLSFELRGKKRKL